jgi:hypothetical protein
MAGGAYAIASTTGALTTAVRFAGAAQAAATGSGALSTALRFAGAAAVVAAAAGALSTSIKLTGAAAVQTSASGTLSGTAAALAGSAACVAAGAGVLTTVVRLAGSAVAQAAGTGGLTTIVRLTGTATARSTGSANFSSVAALFTGTAAAQAIGTGVLTTKIGLQGVATVLASALGALSNSTPPHPGDVIDVSHIALDRIVVFDGSGSRVGVFEGSGSRTVIFEGSENRVRFEEMSVSAKVPVKVGEKWTADRDPDEISYYAADITQELIDRNTTADPDKITAVLFGVALQEGPELQAATIDGVERTFVVVKLGGVEEELPADWRWVARVGCMNGERFDKTTWFNKVDP